MSDPIMKKSQMKTWFLIPFIIFIGVLFMLGNSIIESKSKGNSTDIAIETSLNKPVPTFNLPLLSDTSQMRSNSDLPNHPYLLNVWGSWCPTCIIEHPFLMELHNREVPIIGINYKDEHDNAMNYLAEGGDPFLYSVQDYKGDLAIDLGLTGAPETFVVDANGNIRQHIIGEVNENNWQERISPCMMYLEKLSDEGADSNNTSYANDIAEICS